MKARAFAPGHTTGFFQVSKKGDEIEKVGSKGAGICLNKGAITQVELVEGKQQKIRVYLNRKRCVAPTTEIAVKEIVGKKNFDIKVKTKLQLPICQGFGMSGAGALSTTLALCEILGLCRDEAIRSAHVAEVKAKTGLGDVTPQSIGGFVLSERPGYSVSTIKKLRIEPELKVVLGIIGKGLKTEKLLMDAEKKKIFTENGKICMKEFRKNLSLENFFRVSRQFASKTGMASTEIILALRACDPWGFGTQSMLGNSVFTCGKTRLLSAELRSFGRVINCRVDEAGARVLPEFFDWDLFG